jgi:hypothetical protein
MTVLTFPSNPTEGQIYDAPNEIQYVYDGVEGQIMYLVPTPNTVTPENIKVYVNHGRNGGSQYLNAEFWPFGGNDGSQFFTGSICTLIFTDNHWQQVGGNWV